jgi:hypothetical protein
LGSIGGDRLRATLGVGGVGDVDQPRHESCRSLVAEGLSYSVTKLVEGKVVGLPVEREYPYL